MDSRFQSLARFRASYIEQAPAVQKLDNAIQRTNLYPVDSEIGFAHSYPSHSDLFGGQRCPSFEQPGLKSEFQTPELIPDQSTRKKIPGFRIMDYRTPRISITDSILIRITIHLPDSTRKKFPDSGIRITVHLGYPLLTAFCSVALEIRTGNKT